MTPVPDPVFAKTSPKRSFSITKNDLFGLVFVKTESMNSGTGAEDTSGKFAAGVSKFEICPPPSTVPTVSWNIFTNVCKNLKWRFFELLADWMIREKTENNNIFKQYGYQNC
jgi:hypothetical protein